MAKKENFEHFLTPEEVAESNIYKRLLACRIDFQKKNIQPSGYNAHGDFEYLELKDIVPTATELFYYYQMMLQVSFVNGNCQGVIWDMSNDPENALLFEIPHTRISDPAKSRMNNEIMALGAEMTYLRRYMYMIVLDIIVADEIDTDDKEAPPAVKPAAKATTVKAEPKKSTVKVGGAEKSTAKVVVSSKTPVSTEKRNEIKKEITASDSLADELQINALKTVTSEWVHLAPEDKPKATEILVQTNGFTDCTKKEADALLDKISAKVKALKESAEKE